MLVIMSSGVALILQGILIIFGALTMATKPHTTIVVRPRAYNTRDAAIHTGLSESFLEKARIGKTKTSGPKFKKIGKRVLYLLGDLDSYLESSN